MYVGSVHVQCTWKYMCMAAVGERERQPTPTRHIVHRQDNVCIYFYTSSVPAGVVNYVLFSLPFPSSLSPNSHSDMDDILTEFVSQTQADAALAHDLLEAAEWNLDRALTMYDGFMNTQAVEPEDQISE